MKLSDCARLLVSFNNPPVLPPQQMMQAMLALVYLFIEGHTEIPDDSWEGLVRLADPLADERRRKLQDSQL